MVPARKQCPHLSFYAPHATDWCCSLHVYFTSTPRVPWYFRRCTLLYIGWDSRVTIEVSIRTTSHSFSMELAWLLRADSEKAQGKAGGKQEEGDEPPAEQARSSGQLHSSHHTGKRAFRNPGRFTKPRRHGTVSEQNVKSKRQQT